MNKIFKTVVEKIPSLRWKASELISKTIYTKAFKSFGEGSVIISPLRLKGLNLISMGRNVVVNENAWIEAEPTGQLDIEDNVFLGIGLHIHAVDKINIGEGTTAARNVTFSNGRHDLNDRDRIYKTGVINVGRNCFFGESSIILGNVTIGDNAVIGAGAVVTKDVPAGATVAGVPARQVSK